MKFEIPVYEILIGWRYIRVGRRGQRNGFISFISAISMLGIALGVAALIIVLSVMNGFQKEVRDRMLSIIPHIEMRPANGEPWKDWRVLGKLIRQSRPDILGVAPFVSGQALLANGESIQGIYLRGIDPQHEVTVSPLLKQNQQWLAQIKPGEWNIILGQAVARQIGVKKGGRVTVITPQGQTTVAGAMPRFRIFNVVDIFESGHFEYDNTLALIHITDAAQLLRTGGPTGIQIRIEDPQDAREAGNWLSAVMPSEIIVNDWTRTNRNWFDAVQLEKKLMFIILTLIVAVAAFNLVSTLVMTVTDKTADIAILMTIGATRRSIMTIFMLEGATAGLIGTSVGLVIGLLLAYHIDVIVTFIERLFSTQFLPSSVYIISSMPTDPQSGDIVPITIISLIMAFIATLYPSWRASQVQPAQALRHE